jgi:O-antigen ligase
VDASSPRNFEDLQKPLEQFRAKTRHLKIHPLEQAVLWIVGAQLVFMPWAIGGMRVWSQWIALALAVAGFVVALWPRNYTEEHTGANRFRLIMPPKLLRFPLFWIGLLLLGLVATQALNPAWEYVLQGKTWWMQRIAHIEWLPSGVRVPFARWGPWRMLLIYGAIWLAVCAVWVGLTRRRSVQVLVAVIAANGLALSALGVTQRLLPNGKMFWFWDPQVGSFFASFVYKNHAGAYLFLALSATCGLASWFYLRGLRRLEKSNPSGVFAFFATFIGVSILVSYARGMTLVTLVYLCACVGFFIVHQLVVAKEHRKPVVAIALMLIFGYFLKTGLEALNSHEAWTRLQKGVTDQDHSLTDRAEVTKASAEMLGDTWKLGVGAGSYQFLFTIYQDRYRELQGGLWEHAHNDLLELPIELGVPGMLLILAGVGYLALRLMRSYFWENPLSSCVIFGATLLVIYSWWDFPFANPAILLTWCVLCVAATQWATFEEQHAKG